MGDVTREPLPNFEKFLTTVRELPPEDRWVIAAQLRGVLDNLEPDPASAMDVHVRALIEAFLAGFTIGCETAGD
jgi:hypothetical protein